MNTVVAFPSFDFPATSEIIDLSKLYLSPLNPRQNHDAESIELLAESLVSCGLMQNLGGVKDEEGKVAIVFGGRRLAALQIAVRQRADLGQVPVMIAPDEETALLWGVAENVAREDMSPHQEITAYGRMREKGASVTEIASAFAVTEQHVYRRLKLASLHPLVLEALRETKINLSQAEAFTISDDETKIADALQHAINHRTSAETLRRWLADESVTHTNRKARFVGIDAYEAAGGKITKDLFGEEIYLNDAVLLDELFAAKLEAAAKEQESEWAWVEVCEESSFRSWENGYTQIMGTQVELSDEQENRLEELRETEGRSETEEAELDALIALRRQRIYSPTERALAGVVALVDWHGNLSFDGPYVRPQDAEQALDAGFIRHLSAATGAKAKPKSQFSAAVKDDLKAIKLHAFQTALCANPKLALSIIAFSLSGAAGGQGLLGMRIEPPKNVPSDAEGLAVNPVLVGDTQRSFMADDLKLTFAEFCQKPESEIIEALVAGAVRTIHTNFGLSGGRIGTEFYDSITKALDVDTRSIWTPTKAAFWGRMPASYIDEQFALLTGYGVGTKEFSAFSNQKKGGKAETMERLFTDAAYRAALNLKADQEEAIAAWMPEEDA